MKIDILTLFPGMFVGFFNESIIKRAINQHLVEVNIINFRNYSTLKHQQVDDTPYGGGGGMVLRPEPIYQALKAIKTPESYVILLTPQGITHHQKLAISLSDKKHLIFICGHYEGFDERIRSFVDMELSIGDFVLTGGELPCMVIVDTIIRSLPNVIKENSFQNDSFTDNLLDYPTYTKPFDFNGLTVPEVLLSGDHAKIEKWRKEQQMINTKRKRQDLFQKD